MAAVSRRRVVRAGQPDFSVGVCSILSRKETTMNPLRSFVKHPARLFLLLFLTQVPSLDAQMRMRMATLAPKGTSYHHLLQQMGDQWKQAPNGGVTLTLYTDGTMGGEADMVRRMRVGQIQAAMLTVPGLAEIDPSVGALQKIPMVYQSLD